MKKFILILIPITVIVALTSKAQVLRPFSIRYSNPSVKGNIIQVSNNIFTSVGGVSSSNPGNTRETPPGGASRNNGTLGKNVNIDAMIPFGSNWKYLAGASATPVGWSALAFADGAWPAANGELGYGDGDETTCIPAGSSSGGTLCVPTGNKVITAYFRKIINIPNPLLYTSFRFKVERDDGYVMYINGVEVSRNNMPAGTISHTTVASADVNDGFVAFTVPAASFTTGNNIIAVEVHQRAASSDDLSFDLEMNALTGTSNDIFNSSSANLNLPTCSQVLFAGLYWGATQGVNGTNTSWIVNETSIKLKVPGSSVYQNLTSTQTDYHNGTLVPGLPHTGYRCFRDITSLMNVTNPNGTYSIANIAAPDSIVNGAAGWSIVIAYANPANITRNLTVFDGSAIMDGGNPPLDVTISGFLTPPTGPVSCELGAVVYDGDRTSLDAYKFNGGSGFIDLTPNATSALADMWNSTISAYGANITTRNPAHANTLGFDADIISVPNASNAVLGNNASSATIRFESPSENYFIQTVSTAVSQYTPTFNFSKTSTDVNGGLLAPGDVIRYQLDYQNTGNDASTATVITDKIPRNTTYKAGSITINGVAKTDAIGDDEAEYNIVTDQVVFRLGTGANGSSGGEVNPSESGQVRFEVYTASSCVVFSCASTIVNRARISYGGKISGFSLADSSGVVLSGCTTPNPVSDVLVGSCTNRGDTLLVNVCPSTTVTIPASLYGGYRFYTAIPFNSGNIYNPVTPITFSRLIYAFYDGPGSCDDTIRLNIFITLCPDIDDDNDGIPDYVELNNPLSLQDHDSDGVPNWNDAQYPGYLDLNIDTFNDNFDPSADSDNDGLPNFADPQFPGYTDTNNDGVNDNMDKDLDGTPNHLDLDSDNDGIPDTVESFGVDVNGDGRIDNYTDTDNDGFSQNVDANNTGVTGSNVGLGALDTDSDMIGNYLDLDSDNDGIPDIIEVYETDASNSARVTGFSDLDGDGLTNAFDGDSDNDNIVENTTGPVLKTGTDGNNDGRTDTWPFKNSEGDSKPNPYDLESDSDGITDVKEAQFTDANWDGRVDGPIDANGRNIDLAALPVLNIPNTDGNGRTNPYDIDSDNDGIPDNVEGLTTTGYLLPLATDTDADGIDNRYDNFNGFGGDGIHPVDKDGDTIPDYLDSDTDGDGLIDRVEGNDLNFNGMPDDNVTLTGLDTDGDGLDDRFDANNSSVEGTSAYMGNGGSTSGDPTPGSITVVQQTDIAAGLGCPNERDWRCIFYILNCDITSFKAVLSNNRQVNLDWTTYCRQEVAHFIIQRSIDRVNFIDIDTVAGRPVINESETYTTVDNSIAVANSVVLYYRLITIGVNGKTKISNVITVRNTGSKVTDVVIMPNPVSEQLQVLITATSPFTADLAIMDANGKLLLRYKERILPGGNTLIYQETAKLPTGTYYLRIGIGDAILTRRFNILK